MSGMIKYDDVYSMSVHSSPNALSETCSLLKHGEVMLQHHYQLSDDEQFLEEYVGARPRDPEKDRQLVEELIKKFDAAQVIRTGDFEIYFGYDVEGHLEYYYQINFQEDEFASGYNFDSLEGAMKEGKQQLRMLLKENVLRLEMETPQPYET